jgi:hypothetical protein
MKGGASYYQPPAYLSRGGRRTYKKKGGFYPSLMGGVASNGPFLIAPALAQAARLFRNESDRFQARHTGSRKGSGKSRKTQTRRSKRTNRKAKNTRKA